MLGDNSKLRTDNKPHIHDNYHCSDGSKKRFRHQKPYWNDELYNLWNKMRETEKVYLQFHGSNMTKRRLLSDFKISRQAFDKKLRQCERNYRKVLLKILSQLVQQTLGCFGII